VEDMQSLGRRAIGAAATISRSFLASESVARQLAVPPGTLVVRIQRVRLADNSPLSFD